MNKPMSVLDDVATTQAVDRKNMLRLINELPEQCETALGIGRSFTPEALPEPPNAVFIVGTGDSGMAGEMALQAVGESLSVPVICEHGGRLPKYIGEGSLVFVLDYAGKSASTLQLYKEARQRGARVICITSGGKLREAAMKDGTPFVRIQPGQPSRTAIGYLLIPLILLFEQLGLASGLAEKCSYGIRLMKNVRESLRFENPAARNVAKQIAHALSGKTVVVYGASDYRGPIAARWKSQISANAKSPAFTSLFPNMIESEISGWELARNKEDFALVFLKDSPERAEVAALMEASREVLRDFEVIYAEIKGGSTIERLLYGIYLGDYVSYYLALLAEVDPSAAGYVGEVESQLAGEEEQQPQTQPQPQEEPE